MENPKRLNNIRRFFFLVFLFTCMLFKKNASFDRFNMEINWILFWGIIIEIRWNFILRSPKAQGFAWSYYVDFWALRTWRWFSDELSKTTNFVNRVYFEGVSARMDLKLRRHKACMVWTYKFQVKIKIYESFLITKNVLPWT